MPAPYRHLFRPREESVPCRCSGRTRESHHRRCAVPQCPYAWQHRCGIHRGRHRRSRSSRSRPDRQAPMRLPFLLRPEVEGAQVEHIALEVLRVVIPVRNVSLAEKHAQILKFARPEDAVGPDALELSGVGRLRYDRWVPVAVVEALHGVRLAVPTRIVPGLPRSRIAHRVTVRVVGKHVPGVVGDDIQYHIDPVIVGGLHEVTELLARSEMAVDVEEVLDAVTVIACRIERDLAEDRAYPESSDAEAFEIPELAL